MQSLFELRVVTIEGAGGGLAPYMKATTPMRRMLLSAGLGLTLCTTSLALPAAARTDDASVATTRTTATRSEPAEVRPVPVPNREPSLDVMTMACQLDGLVAGCEWRPTTAATAVGYQLWRIVDRGERELVWRGGLDATAARDRLPEGTLAVRYAVVAVDADGNRVGQARPITLIVERDDDGPVVDDPITAPPTEVQPDLELDRSDVRRPGIGLISRYISYR